MNEQPNKLTLQAYNDAADIYAEVTPPAYTPSHQPMLNWINTSLSGLAPTARVLEVGSATLRDATYIRSKGYFVQTSDAPAAFVENLRKNDPNAIQLNILTDPIPANFDLIFANAVIPHFTEDDMKLFLDKVEQALNKGQRLAFSAKQGQGDSWIHEKFDNKRYIHYWIPESLRNLLLSHHFNIIFFDTGIAGDLPTHTWINVAVEKI
jgi:hypothetical protein